VGGEILRLFRSYDVNHVVYMMNYRVNSTEVCKVLRDHIEKLTKEADCSTLKSD
jgi:hypothetical protein